MFQAVLLDCPFFDLFSFSENGFVAAEVDVGWCDVVRRTVVGFTIRLSRALRFEIVGSVASR